MDRVEGTLEVGEAVGNSAEAGHLKRKEKDQPLQLPESCNVLSEHPQPIISVDSGWLEHLSSSTSPEFMEILAGKSQSVSEPIPANPGVMVEELTVRNYKSPDLYMGGCSTSTGEQSSFKKSLWPNLTRLAGVPRDVLLKESLVMGNREGVGSLFLPPFGLQRPLPPLDPNHNKVSEHEDDGRVVLSNVPAERPGGIRTKFVSASGGFSQFMVKNTLKGKGVASRRQQAHNMHGVAIRSQNNERSVDNAVISSDSYHNPNAKADGMSLGSDVHHEEFRLREWLKQGYRKFNKAERMHLFKQILDLVDILHSQGFALQHLRPSNFMILPTNQVKYIGSLGPKDQMEGLTGSTDDHHSGRHSKRRRLVDPDKEVDLSPKLQVFGEHSKPDTFPNRTVIKGDITEKVAAGRFKSVKAESDFRKELSLGEPYHPRNMPLSAPMFSFGCRMSESEFLKLEERWYASPEELNGNLCSFSSNIYNLGVLHFELFCYFETWEVHSAAMSDLRCRILPQNFLSESPKEASFCLWLLHPEPSSRPKSRDVIKCDLICEGRDFSYIDQSPASVEEEDAEADLLLHFLLASKKQKEQQAAKLVSELGCLQSDIEEVDRRHSARNEFLLNARNSLTNFNGISDTCPQKRPLNLEAMPRMSMLITNEERLMKNIDQLENAYLSMRFKIEPSETKTIVRSDSDIVKIRERSLQVQNDGDVWKESTDRLGAFFEGLCKYARYSRFEVRGSLRNVDILNSANVICSLSFDRDEEYFAAAGVSKKIKIFEFGALLNDSVDIHYPMIEMPSRTKLSCVCWNKYVKNYLASTDYDGVVQLWDASTGQGFTQYAEHQKRAWSVDFSQTDPIKLASGSDDCTVKLWSINERNCIDTIRSTANVCCVQFSDSSHMLAFGTADYKVNCYDLRNTRIPWCTLAGHGKAVSYVKFVDSETLVSASTDNTLKLWDLNKTNTCGISTGACSLTYSGHTNEKNFVGLSVSDGYIACGSETNEVYAYYKTLPMPITGHKFGSIDPITGQETADDNGLFVSSVCWRGKSNMAVVANSTGSMKVLQLV